MNVRSFVAIVFWAALLAGILVWWSPRYWPLAIGIGALAVAALTWALTARTVEWSRPMLLVAPIGAWGFLQLAFGLSAIPSFTLRVSLTWAMCAASFFLGAQILADRTARGAFLNWSLWTVTALAVEALIQLYSAPGRVFGLFPAPETVVGTMIYGNQSAALMELAAPIALWRVKQGRVLAGGLAFAAMFAATVAAASRAGFALLLAELVVFVLVMILSGQWRIKAAAAITLIVALLLGWAAAVAGTERLWTKLQEKNPYEFRRELLHSTVAMIHDAPWVGHGIGTWRAVYPHYATLDLALIANEAHNDWAQWASDGGIPFALLIAALAIWIAAPALTSVWGMGVLVVLVHCWVDYPMRAQPIAFLWFALAGGLSTLPRRVR